MPIHIAITRRVRAICEDQLQQALREFFQTSFMQGGVLGVSLLHLAFFWRAGGRTALINP